MYAARWGAQFPRDSPRSMSSLCPPLGLLSTLRQVVSAPASASTSPANTLCAAETLRDVLQLVVVGAEPGDPVVLAERMAACARACLQRLVDIVVDEREEEDDDEVEEEGRAADTVAVQACELICQLVACIAR